MDWSAGFSAQYYAYFVDTDSWRNLGRIELIGGSISNVADSLRSSATINMVRYDGGSDRWLRIYLDARQGDDSAHIPLFTGIVTTPGDEINGSYITNTLTGYSVLKPCDDVYLERGYYVPAGASSDAVLRELLSVTPAPVEIEAGAPALSEAIIAEDGESHLTMADKVINAMGWRMRIQGDGTIQITQQATDAGVFFDPLENDAIEPEMTVNFDWFGCPNVFRAISGNMVGIARDDSPKSPLSTVRRGREVWAEDSSAELNAGETIAEYATRRLKEEQQKATEVDYNRRYRPDLIVGDLVSLHYPEQGLNGTYKIVSQSIELGHGARTGEKVSNG